MARKRHTKAQYIRLFNDPAVLFPPHGENRGACVTLFPNGENEIWIQGQNGKGYRITASEGRAGLALCISTFAGAPPITLSGNEPNGTVIQGLPDARWLDLCQYNPDESSQRFKAAYQAGDLSVLTPMEAGEPG